MKVTGLYLVVRIELSQNPEFASPRCKHTVRDCSAPVPFVAVPSRLLCERWSCPPEPASIE